MEGCDYDGGVMGHVDGGSMMGHADGGSMMGCVDGGSQAPRLGRLEIEGRAEGLLEECWDGVFPVDVEAICDYLGVAIVSVAGLAEKFGVDAYVSADFRTIYVDEFGYRVGSNRYRFSVAHELGHLVLHREYFSSRVESFEEWVGLAQGGASRYVEYQANYFAGNLLAPGRELVGFLNAEFDGRFARNCWWVGRGELVRAFRKLRKFFRVSEQVVARRIRDVMIGSEGFKEIIKIN